MRCLKVGSDSYYEKVKYFRSRIISRLKDYESDIGPTFRLYMDSVMECNDLEELKEMAELDMQLDYFDYIRDLNSKLEMFGVSLDDIKRENAKSKEASNDLGDFGDFGDITDEDIDSLDDTEDIDDIDESEYENAASFEEADSLREMLGGNLESILNGTFVSVESEEDAEFNDEDSEELDEYFSEDGIESGYEDDDTDADDADDYDEYLPDFGDGTEEQEENTQSKVEYDDDMEIDLSSSEDDDIEIDLGYSGSSEGSKVADESSSEESSEYYDDEDDDSDYIFGDINSREESLEESLRQFENGEYPDDEEDDEYSFDLDSGDFESESTESEDDSESEDDDYFGNFGDFESEDDTDEDDDYFGNIEESEDDEDDYFGNFEESNETEDDSEEDDDYFGDFDIDSDEDDEEDDYIPTEFSETEEDDDELDDYFGTIGDENGDGESEDDIQFEEEDELDEYFGDIGDEDEDSIENILDKQISAYENGEYDDDEDIFGGIDDDSEFEMGESGFGKGSLMEQFAIEQGLVVFQDKKANDMYTGMAKLFTKGTDKVEQGIKSKFSKFFDIK